MPPTPQGYPVELTLNGVQQFQGSYASPDILPWVASASAAADGERLFNWLFSAGPLRQAWVQTRGQCPQRRIRLRLDEAAPELHPLPWELLSDSSPGLPPQLLAADAATPFSRYLAGHWPAGQPVTARPVRFLVAIANPDNLAEYQLAGLDGELERQLIQTALAEAGPDQVELTLMAQPVTLAALEEQLRTGYHVLHVVAHGHFNVKKGIAALYLADEDNDVRPVKAAEFAAMLQRQGQLPQLVFLASCQTASRSPAEAFRGFAPELIAGGVPAVLAMQDLIPMQTAQEFARVFYRQLLRHGRVDLAGNEARSALLTAELPGSTIPVLFSRLPDNRLFDVSSATPAKPRLPFEPETVLIPAGPFLMGSLPGEAMPPDEAPQHEVNLPVYRIGQYPVTNAQYVEFVKRNFNRAYLPRRAGWFLDTPPADKLDHPVVGITWFEAQAYCRWLSQETGRTYRLPTEAEWEKAARGTDGRLYPWGNTWEAGYANAAHSQTCPVTAHAQGASLYGCYDMASNVQEWTSTLWGRSEARSDFPYPYRADDGREAPPVEPALTRTYRVHRGGSYQDEPVQLRCSARGHSDAESAVSWRGFRVVLEIE